MPAFSKSNTSSESATAICLHTVERGISLRTNDHCRIVTGPVNIPFITRLVKLCAYSDQRTVIGVGRVTSPKITGGFTQREP